MRNRRPASASLALFATVGVVAFLLVTSTFVRSEPLDAPVGAYADEIDAAALGAPPESESDPVPSQAASEAGSTRQARAAELNALAATFSEEDLEALRAKFLKLADTVHRIDGRLRMDTETIEALDHEHLASIRAALREYETFSRSVDALALLVEDPSLGDAAYELLAGDPWTYAGRTEQAVLDAARMERKSQAFPTPIPNLTPLIPLPALPTPLPQPKDPLAIVPTPQIDASWPSDTSEGLWPPNYPTYSSICQRFGNTTVRSDEVAGLVLVTLNGALDITNAILEDVCDFDVAILGNDSNIIQCAAALIGRILALIPKYIQEGIERCDAEIDSVEIEAGFQNTQRLLFRLRTHELAMRESIQISELKRQDIQVFQERLWIEQNLASATDDPNVLLMLPESADCTPLLGEPARIATPDGRKRERCGMLGQVQYVVAQTISMVEESGESTNNAQAEYDAALVHLAAGDYRDAYARFKNAYREAVSTRGSR